MISKEQYAEAVKHHDAANEIINQFFTEKREAFAKRLEENPTFTDDELRYSALQLCPCGHGMAYPKECSPGHYWDCSAILKGIADESVQHTGQLPFAMYNVKGESERNGTTRGVFNPRDKVAVDNERA